MKKGLLVLLALSFVLVNDGYSQILDLREEFNFGFKAGVNRANVYDEVGEGFTADRKYGFAAGAFAQIPLGTYIGIQPELLYSQRGYKGTQRIAGRQFEYTRNLGFVDVPLLLQIKPAESFYVVLGPQYSLLLRQGERFESGNTTIEDQRTIQNQSLRRNTIAATGGFDINFQNVVLSGRAGWDLQNNLGSGNSYSPRYRNAWVQGTLGVRF